MTDYKFHVLTIDGITVLVKVFLSKKAIANNVCFPGPAKVKKEIKEHYPWIKDRRFYKPGEDITLYWTGQLFVEKAEYDLRIDNLQVHWQKVRAKKQAEREREATVNDVLQFVRELRCNSVNSNGNSNIKAGQGTSEGRDLIDRCEGVK